MDVPLANHNTELLSAYQKEDQMVRILNGLGSIFGVFLTFGPAVSFSGDRAT